MSETEASFGRVRDACAEAGRDPASMRFSVAHTVVCGKDDAEVARRASAIGWSAQDVRTRGITGTPAQVVDTIGEFGRAGAGTIYLQVLDLSDLDHLELVAADVLPQV
jgi:alkanesulfonate monooxygenase SsuD/methylene tetrahydromethanopterin reductase-like flavin-dependent oxidoreductase (luciferase family)